jgi:hypothetical protein
VRAFPTPPLTGAVTCSNRVVSFRAIFRHPDLQCLTLTPGRCRAFRSKRPGRASYWFHERGRAGRSGGERCVGPHGGSLAASPGHEDATGADGRDRARPVRDPRLICCRASRWLARSGMCACCNWTALKEFSALTRQVQDHLGEPFRRFRSDVPRISELAGAVHPDVLGIARC